MVQPPSPAWRGASSRRIDAAIRSSRKTISGGLPDWASRMGRSIASTSSGAQDERAVSCRCRWSHVVLGQSSWGRSGRGSGAPGNRVRKRRLSKILREAIWLAVFVRSLFVCGWSMRLPRAAFRRGERGGRRQWGRFVGVKIAMPGEQPRGLAPGGHAQPLAGLADAHVDAGRRYAQLKGDFLGGKAARDQRQARPLARRQAGDPLGRR